VCLLKGSLLGLVFANRKWLGVSLVFLVAFFCVLFLRGYLVVFDFVVSGWVFALHLDWVTVGAVWVSFAFDTYSLLGVSLVVAGYFFYKNHLFEGVLLLVAMGGVAALVGGFKVLVHSARPLDGLIVDLGYSFPSGHTAGSLVFCGLLAYFAWHRWKSPRVRVLLSALVVGVVCVVGFDRLYLNVHWFSDVLGGCLLGLFWLTFVILLAKLLGVNKGWLPQKFPKKGFFVCVWGWWLVACFLLFSAVFVSVFVDGLSFSSIDVSLY